MLMFLNKEYKYEQQKSNLIKKKWKYYFYLYVQYIIGFSRERLENWLLQYLCLTRQKSIRSSEISNKNQPKALTQSKFQYLSDHYLAGTSISDPSNNIHLCEIITRWYIRWRFCAGHFQILTPGAISWAEFFFTVHSMLSLVICAISVAIDK